MENLSWLHWLLAIAGSLAWASPWVYEIFKKSVIKGRILAFLDMTDADVNYLDRKTYKINKIEGLEYVLKLSILSLNRSFNIRNIKAKIKYSDAQWRDAKLFYAENINIRIRNLKGTIVKHAKIEPRNHMSFLSVLDKDKTYDVWVTLIVDKATTTQFEELVFVFYDYKEKVQQISFKWSDIDSLNLYGLGEIIIDDSLETVSPNTKRNKKRA